MKSKPQKLEYMKRYYQRTRGKKLQYQKQYRKDHPEKMQEWYGKNPQKIQFYRHRLLNYKGKQITLKENPRIGVCSNCHRSVENGAIMRTQLHHLEYDNNNPLNHTIELCVRCHRQEHARLRRIENHPL